MAFGTELEVSVLKGFLGSLKFSRMTACWKREGILYKLAGTFLQLYVVFLFSCLSLFKLILFYFVLAS